MSFTPYPVNPELDLVLEREVAVPPELVWRAWTEPELLKQFFTPRPWETPDAEVDLRPGGVFRTVMRSPEGDEFDNTGCYLEIVPGEKLSWTSVLGPDYRPRPTAAGDVAMTAIIELEPTATGGTRYRAVAVHNDVDSRAQHEEMGFHDGWGTVLDQLVELMTHAT
ncbi:MAG: SRPBCC family protein [Acidimicrobiales bacterium]|nr:SRPBCC family protein [Acidimicrobiales bacterium]